MESSKLQDPEHSGYSSPRPMEKGEGGWERTSIRHDRRVPAVCLEALGRLEMINGVILSRWAEQP